MSARPFAEAINYLRNKHPVPTQFWNDLAGTAHAKSFAVAGATKAALLRDIQTALTDALEKGTPLADFKNSFTEITQRHGWQHRGSRAWRARVIYDTNLITARAAGRWQQIQRNKERLPYLQYLTAGDEHVRASHQQWHNIVLRVDDTWWQIYYPPNDWGCRCGVRALSAAAVERLGLTVSESPTIDRVERINTKTGEIYGDIPVGIGPGWDHNPGIAWLGPDIALGEHIANAPDWISAAILSDTDAIKAQLARPYAAWLASSIATARPANTVIVGYLGLEALAATRAANAAVSMRSGRWLSSPALSEIIALTDLAALPGSIATPVAILHQIATGKLIYVLGKAPAGDQLTVATIRPSTSRVYASEMASIEKMDKAELLKTDKYHLLQGNLNGL